MTLRWHGPEVRARIERAVAQSLVRTAEAVATDAARRVLSPPKTGRIYVRRGVTHQASARGEAPASDTGRLVNSITIRFNRAELVSVVTANTKYASYLEWGTRRMKARPFMRPAVAAKRSQIELDMARTVLAALQVK